MTQPVFEIDDPTLDFLQTLWALDHNLQSHSKRMKSTAGVTSPQRLVLRILALQPKLGPSDLARVLHFHKSTITVIVRSLERAKLVRRVENPEDGRGYLLSLTPRGEAIAKKRTGTVESVVRAVLEKQPSNDIKAARKVLDALARSLA